MQRPQKNRQSSPARSAARPSQEEVSREAFKIYQSRHGAPGDPVADWYQAERIVMSRISGKSPRQAQASGGRPRRSQAEAPAVIVPVSAIGGRSSSRETHRQGAVDSLRGRVWVILYEDQQMPPEMSGALKGMHEDAPLTAPGGRALLFTR